MGINTMAESKNESPFASILQRSLGSGLSGSIAMGAQVTSLMWLRTTVNYQYRNGGTSLQALKDLYKEGGVRRFYRGYPVAMIQAPLARFGDVACYSLVRNTPEGQKLPLWAQTSISSVGTSLWRLGIMPIDSLKTSMQVHGSQGYQVLRQRVGQMGYRALFHGYLATASASMLGYYPWFFTYGFLDTNLPQGDDTLTRLSRNATMGFVASAASDTVSNSARVLKTYRQTNPTNISYTNAVKDIIKFDGWRELLGRGLKTKIISNGIQGATFSIVWKYLEKEVFSSKAKPPQQ
jgi:hypothetical protein